MTVNCIQIQNNHTLSVSNKVQYKCDQDKSMIANSYLSISNEFLFIHPC